MRLFVYYVAPNPTKVRVYVREKGIEIEEVIVNMRKGEQRTPEHRARSPFGTLPVLELDDGSNIDESLPIIEYLEERHPEPPLFGETPEQRVRVRRLERVADLRVLLQAARVVHATRSPLGYAPSETLAASARKALAPALDHLDALLADREFLAGERLTVADCTLYAGLQFPRFLDMPVHTEHAHLVRWFDAFDARPSARDVAP